MLINRVLVSSILRTNYVQANMYKCCPVLTHVVVNYEKYLLVVCYLNASYLNVNYFGCICTYSAGTLPNEHALCSAPRLPAFRIITVQLVCCPRATTCVGETFDQFEEGNREIRVIDGKKFGYLQA